jgi:hypothetical protein
MVAFSFTEVSDAKQHRHHQTAVENQGPASIACVCHHMDRSGNKIGQTGQEITLGENEKQTEKISAMIKAMVLEDPYLYRVKTIVSFRLHPVDAVETGSASGPFALMRRRGFF